MDIVESISQFSSYMPQMLLVLLISIVAFAVFGIVFGCLFNGIDRKISARLQGRIGPPILQPLYDVKKLFAKEKSSTNNYERIYITLALIFVFIAGGIFVSGLIGFFFFPNENYGNLLLCIFMLTFSSLMLIMASSSSGSPYSEIGSAREILQVAAYEPTTILFAVCFFMSYGTFSTGAVFTLTDPVVLVMWPMLICLAFVLLIKLRKSPFDISLSHHAHQEIVQGIETEMSGPTLAKVEIMHWCETFLFTLWLMLFFASSDILWCVIGVFAVLIIYFLLIFIDNNCARVKWQAMLKWSWIICVVLCTLDMLYIIYFI